MAGAAPAAAPALFPVLLFSPGNDMLSAQYTFLLEELASQGFVVVGLDHPYDTRATLLASGKVVGFLGSRWPALPAPTATGAPPEVSQHARFYRERVGVRAADARFVADSLTDQNDAGTPESVLSGRLDFSRIGFFGHSAGGVAAGDVCQADLRFKACLNLDGESGNGPFYLDGEGKGFEQLVDLLVSAGARAHRSHDAELSACLRCRNVDTFAAARAGRRHLGCSLVDGAALRAVLALVVG